MAQVKGSRSWRWPLSVWGIFASVLYAVGTIAVLIRGNLIISEGQLEKDALQDALRTLLALGVVIGLFLNGIGLLMRAAAHGAKGRGRVVDGIGKMVSLLGWSISLTGAMIFTLEQTTIPQDAVVPWAAGLVLFPGAGHAHHLSPSRSQEEERPRQLTLDGGEIAVDAIRRGC